MKTVPKTVGLILIILLLLYVSCNSFEEREGNSYTLDEVIVEDLEEMIQSGSSIKALQEIDTLSREEKIDELEINRLNGLAISSIQQALKSAYAKGEFNAAYRYYLSLQAVSEEYLPPQLSLQSILLSIAHKYVETGDNLQALSIYLDLIKAGRVSDQEKRDFLVFASQCGYLSAMRTVLADLGPDSLEPEEMTSYGKQIATKTSHQEMMKGTATIWVDKGIKIERGIGYPDRVMGSGFFIDSRGYLLTNYHVIASEVDPEYEGYSRLYVRLPDRVDEKIPAKVTGWDEIFDLALLKIEVEPDFVFQSIGNTDVEPGQKVFVIGSPVDPFLENTITAGIVSAVGRRKLLQMGDVIQVDASVNPGNSGGPMIDENGELAGIVFAGLQQFQGLNFAIPIKWVNKIVPRLFEGKAVVHSWLGMALVETNGQLEAIYTVPGESAERGGIKSGDIIKSINGIEFNSIRDLQEFILDFPVSSLVRLNWLRGGEEEISGLFSLSKRPFSPMELALNKDSRINVLLPLFGLEIKEVSNFLWEKNYVVERVIKGSIADNTGISKSDPLNLQRWNVDEENRYVILQIYIKKKKAGFFESIVQLIAYMESDNFI